MGLALALGLSACTNNKLGDGSTTENGAVEELAPEYTYVAKFSAIPENMMQGNFALSGKYLYGIESNYDHKYSRVLKSTMSDEGISDAKTVMDWEQAINVSGLAVDANENIWMIFNEYPEEPEDASPEEMDKFYENYEENSKNFLRKYDAKGKLIFETDLAEQKSTMEYFYPQSFCVDDQGRSYIYCYHAGILLFDENGAYAGKIDFNQDSAWMNAMGTAKDGKVYVAYQEYGPMSSGSYLAALDFEGKKLGKVYKNFPCANGNSWLCRGMEADLICGDQYGLYEYSLEKEEAKKILTWLDIDVAGDSISAIHQNEDGLHVITYNYSDGSADFVALNKVKSDEVEKRIEIIVGCLYEDGDLTSKIIKFNKSNSKYRIKLKTYMDPNDWNDNSYTDAITNFNNDVISENGPDVIDLSNLDVANLAAKGLLEDLGPYLDKSSKLSRSDFFDRILKAGTYNGVLAYVPTSFTLETLAGKTSIVGSKAGWTIADMIKLKEANPKAELLEYADKDTVLSMMLILNKGYFIDSVKGECHFDSNEFKDLLKFANSFPKEYDYENQSLTPIKLKNGSLILVNASIYEFQEVQSIDAYFDGEAYTYIGYPTYNGGNGCILSTRGRYGISVKSQNKEAAWAFLEDILLSDDERYGFGFSSIKSKYEEQKSQALEVRYVYDENGEIMKDENGNPYYENGGGYVMTGDNGEEWTYQYRPVTKEEVDLVERLLEGASVIDTSVDEELMKIITEETQSYFAGSKSVDEVAGIIQNRVNLYLKENY